MADNSKKKEGKVKSGSPVKKKPAGSGKVKPGTKSGKATSAKAKVKKTSASAAKTAKKSTPQKKTPVKASTVKSAKSVPKKKSYAKTGTPASSPRKKPAPEKAVPAASRKTPVKKKKSANDKKKSKELVASKKIPPATEEEYIDPDALKRGDEPMTVVDHLDEFRSRILIVLGTIIVLTIAGFFFSDYLLKVINDPFESTGHKLNIFKLTGGFILRLKVSVIAGIMLGMPVLVYHVWGYISPAVAINDRKFSRVAIASAVLLFYAGVAFVFFLLLPFAIKMLLSFIGEDMLSTIGANDYLSFILISSIAMGILFELPIVVMVLTRIGILTPYFLIQKRKYAIVIAWVIAALITPQDIVSQILVAIPLMFLYEVSILLSRFMVIRKKKKDMEK